MGSPGPIVQVCKNLFVLIPAVRSAVPQEMIKLFFEGEGPPPVGQGATRYHHCCQKQYI